LTADSIIAFVQADAMPRKGFGPHGTATAVRSFLRFLVVQHRLPASLDRAIPTVRRWSHAALPQPLSDTDIDQMLQCCADGTASGTRNYAILLLLSRLGLGAKEVANLQLHDVDWVHGSLLIRASKTHAEHLLPLAQDVGEALLAYLLSITPRVSWPSRSSAPIVRWSRRSPGLRWTPYSRHLSWGIGTGVGITRCS
jgi:integrase